MMTPRDSRNSRRGGEPDRSTPPSGGAMNTCAICGASYPRGQSCPRCQRPQYRVAAGGIDKGKWTTIAVLVGVFALLMVGAYFLIKNLAHTGEQYGRALQGSQEKGARVSCAVQLAVIHKSLQIAAASAGGKFPRSLTELYSPSELRCPSDETTPYLYVPGQDESMPPDNVLVYEPKAVHNGRCSVLRLGGRVELLTPQELGTELDATRAVIAARKQ